MRNLKKSEEIVLLLLAAALIGLFYYQFVYKGLQEAKVQYNTSVLETELAAYQTKAASMQQMQEQIESGKLTSDGVVATYNNQKQEIIALNNIFEDAETFNLNFQEPTAYSGDTTVRRGLQITFAAASYETAREMLEELYHCEYRCLLQDITISPSNRGNGGSNSLSGGAVEVSVTVTFYETLYNAPSTDGINFLDSQSSE